MSRTESLVYRSAWCIGAVAMHARLLRLQDAPRPPAEDPRSASILSRRGARSGRRLDSVACSAGHLSKQPSGSRVRPTARPRLRDAGVRPLATRAQCSDRRCRQLREGCAAGRMDDCAKLGSLCDVGGRSPQNLNEALSTVRKTCDAKNQLAAPRLAIAAVHERRVALGGRGT